jgi:adenylylsulfate kinase
MSGAGKSTLSGIVAKSLRRKGFLVEVIDGDEYRENLCKDLGFSKEDRNTNIRRLSFVSKVLSRNKVISIIAAINPYEEVRQENKRKDDSLKTVYVKCDLDTLIQRDVKGLYAKAMLPDNDPDKIYNFTGISDPFEEPQEPDLIINTNKQNIQTCSRILEKFILKSV